MTGFISITEIAPVDKKSIGVKWEFPKSYENKINGFKISVASRAEGPYTDVVKKNVPKNSRAFSVPPPTGSVYFQVKAMDTEGRLVSQSFPFFYHVEDNLPPRVPTKLVGKVGDTGVVTLTWEANQESDLMGYRVFVANNPSSEFVEATQFILPAPIFKDSVDLGLLNKKVYYKLVAVDQNYNASDYSSAISVTIPDKIAPAAPVFSKASATPKSIELEWILSSSADVAGYKLLRIDDQDTTKALIQNWAKGKVATKYSDANLESGKIYSYEIAAYDSAGNVASTTSKKIIFENRADKAVTDFTATINREEKTIHLAWNYPKPAKKTILYRRKGNEPFTLYQAIGNGILEFTDDLVVINNTYSYKIQLVDENGVKTELSKELKVPF